MASLDPVGVYQAFAGTSLTLESGGRSDSCVQAAKVRLQVIERFVRAGSKARHVISPRGLQDEAAFVFSGADALTRGKKNATAAGGYCLGTTESPP